MTMRITMLQTRMGESGSLLTVGSTYTVSKEFGAEMVGSRGYATDTDGVLSSPKATGLQDMKYDPLTQSAVSADGNLLLMGAATFTATDAGSEWYRAPEVLQVAATLDSGTATTVLIEVRTLAGVVSTALTITADTIAQTLRTSILTREMHEFRIRRSSGTGTVTVIV